MRKFLLGWFAFFMGFASIAGLAMVIRWDAPLTGVVMALFCGLISWRSWRARTRPSVAFAPEPRPWER